MSQNKDVDRTLLALVSSLTLYLLLKKDDAAQKIYGPQVKSEPHHSMCSAGNPFGFSKGRLLGSLTLHYMEDHRLAGYRH